jgi:hypothetical protein
MTFVAPHKPSKVLADELAEIISKAGQWSPRSKQIAIGPSEIGHECSRRLAYKLLDWEKINEGGSSSWSAQVGTAIHAYLAEVFGKIEGYEVEQRVTIRSGLSGSIDLFDVNRGIVMDWKTTSSKQIETRRKEGATKQQLIQTQLYGYGKAQQGAIVNHVALVYLPTSGSLDDMHMEMYEYDEQVALDALARIDSLYTLLSTVDVESNPQMWDLIPAEPTRLCSYCPYFLPYSKDLSRACHGDSQ